MSESGKSEKVCVVAGVGEGLGAALALCLAAATKSRSSRGVPSSMSGHSRKHSNGAANDCYDP